MSGLATLLDAGLTLQADGRRLLVTPAACLSDPLRKIIRENVAELLEQVREASRLTAELIDAINRACDLRGDDDENRAGLIRECSALPSDGQEDMRQHFEQVAEVWAKATGQPARGLEL